MSRWSRHIEKSSYTINDQAAIQRCIEELHATYSKSQAPSPCRGAQSCTDRPRSLSQNQQPATTLKGQDTDRKKEPRDRHVSFQL